MSGRVRTELADGRVVTGYRKTLRRNPRRPVLERVHLLNEKRMRRVVTGWKARLGFLLPKDLQRFISSGAHGLGVDVHRGFVQIGHNSADQCFQRARHFLAEVASGGGPYVMPASVISPDHPEARYSRHLVFVTNILVVVGSSEPRVYQ